MVFPLAMVIVSPSTVMVASRNAVHSHIVNPYDSSNTNPRLICAKYPLRRSSDAPYWLVTRSHSASVTVPKFFVSAYNFSPYFLMDGLIFDISNITICFRNGLTGGLSPRQNLVGVVVLDGNHDSHIKKNSEKKYIKKYIKIILQTNDTKG